MSNSTHKVEVVPVKLHVHPNADSLSLVYPFGEDGYVVVVRTEDWRDRTIGAYIPPDSVVDSKRPEFAFLRGHERIKVRMFRKIISQGLLVEAPAGASVGDDVAEKLGVTHYNPPEPSSTGAGTAKVPMSKIVHRPKSFKSWVRYFWYRFLRATGLLSSSNDLRAVEAAPVDAPDYDIESYYRYPHVLNAGEEVVATEKRDGCNARYVYLDGEMHCGSHHRWVADGGNVWWNALRQNPQIKAFCERYPGVTLYGEVFGASVQGDAPYGYKTGELAFEAFDVRENGRWVDYNTARSMAKLVNLTWVPVVYQGGFDGQYLMEISETLTPKDKGGKVYKAEGIVVRPLVERIDRRIGRVQLKIVSKKYLEKGYDSKK